jgi:hypothetical protein
MRHSVQNDTLEKSNEVELWCDDHCQLDLVMNAELENSDDQAMLTPQYNWKWSCLRYKK